MQYSSFAQVHRRRGRLQLGAPKAGPVTAAAEVEVEAVAEGAEVVARGAEAITEAAEAQGGVVAPAEVVAEVVPEVVVKVEVAALVAVKQVVGFLAHPFLDQVLHGSKGAGARRARPLGQAKLSRQPASENWALVRAFT